MCFLPIVSEVVIFLAFMFFASDGFVMESENILNLNNFHFQIIRDFTFGNSAQHMNLLLKSNRKKLMINCL